ncbi:hypothetical protein JK628_23205 (plasmid) [Shewanella sp. KX20019]|uniref:hypothetical protein n=1 Tax=Shewanella sp. KX20019 TaxID=2803864 RepID=UPI00192723AE|nr:hypothetical protein [Shewanella sp. KX20019]QQX82692.1 hypothetical protein JK628_23205 [Shewanella sp. KX20019]
METEIDLEREINNLKALADKAGLSIDQVIKVADMAERKRSNSIHEAMNKTLANIADSISKMDNVYEE